MTEEQLLLLLARKRNKYLQSHLVSLGDLGRKDIRHEQGDAGTTKSFVDAKAYFDAFEGIPYDLVTVRKRKTDDGISDMSLELCFEISGRQIFVITL